VTNVHEHVDIEVQSVFSINGVSDRFQVARDKRSHSAVRRTQANLRKEYGIAQKGPASKHVWYTGENLRPPTDWDLTLTFDLEPLLGANWYLPHWAIRLGDLGGQDPNDPFHVTNATLLSPRAPMQPRTKFACLLAGNPHPFRTMLLEAMGEVGTVDTYGAMFGNPVHSKLDLFSEYQFAIVPENDLYPGYVTEKVIEAWLAGCIPVWWGSDPAGYINPNAVLNLAEMPLPSLILRIRDLVSDPSEMQAMNSQPLLSKPYDFNACIAFTREKLQGL